MYKCISEHCQTLKTMTVNNKRILLNGLMETQDRIVL